MKKPLHYFEEPDNNVSQEELARRAASTGDIDAVNFLVENGFIERRYVCKRCGLLGEDCGCEPSGDFE